MPSLRRGFLALGVWCLLLWWSPHLTESARGTTPNLEEIFVGRCWDYQRVVNPGPFTGGRGKNCSELWQHFSRAFMYKDACNVTIESYGAFTRAAIHDVPRDKIMLWGDTFYLVHEYTMLGKRAYAMADTLLGYMATNVAWCGKVEEPGVDYESCPAWGSCDRAADLSYWRSVSRAFAEGAEGAVRAMVNGSNGHVYRNNRESCGNGTMVELQSKVERMGIKYGCTNDPIDIRYLMCVDDVDAPECRMISEILAAPQISGSDHVVPV